MRTTHGLGLTVLAAVALGNAVPAEASYVLLPSRGTGYYSYVSSYRRWGQPRMVNGLITMGRRWRASHPGKTLRYGDISKRGGGYFPPHVSHRYGIDVDMSPITTSGSAGITSVGYRSYSTYYNIQFARLQRAVWRVRVMLHNNRRIPGVTFWPGHYNHFHTRIY